jgi:outer membrane lipoprotein-sorting protein
MTICVVAVVVAAQSPLAEAESATAQGILKKADDVNNDYRDQEFVTRMTLKSGDKVEKVVEMQVLQKGGTKRLIRIMKPADVRGLAVLVEDVNTAYVYLPQFNKVRRVATHANKQSFLGSDFTEVEMGIIRYGDSFEPALAGRDGDAFVLKLTPRPGKGFDLAYLKMWVDRRTSFITKIEYYGPGDAKLKTQTLGEIKTIGGVTTQTRVIMTDHFKNHSTEMEILSVKENQGLKDEVFTLRALEWGR